MRNSFGIAGALLVAVAGVGHAQAIQVTDVQVNATSGRRVNPGGTVHVRANWAPSGTKPEVTATLGGKDVTVLSADAEYVSIHISPYQDVGKVKLQITVRGKGQASVDLEIVKELVGGDETKSGSSQPDAADQVLASFEITKLALVSTPAGKQIEAEGAATRLPDGFQVVITIGPDGGPPIQPVQTAVKGGAWKAIFGPWTTDVPCGSWKATLLFELGRQGKIRAREFKTKIPANEQAAFERVERQDIVIVGTDEERAAQRNELKNHAKTLVALATRLFDDVDKAYVSGSRCFFRNPAGGLFDAKWEGWLKDQKLIADTPEALVVAKNDNRFARNGHFQVDPWTKWATDTLLPPLAKARQDHEDFSKRWFTPPDPAVERIQGEILTLVSERLRNTGQALCNQTKIPFPVSVAEQLPTTSAGNDQVSRQSFEAKCKLLLRTLGESVPD